MIIRPEEKQDFNEIYTVVKAAFATAEHSDGNEQDLVIALRTGNNYIQKLSLVAKLIISSLVILCLQQQKLEMIQY